MRHYDYHKISDDAFEDLTCIIAKNILGQGFTGFSKGKDGGRDGKFEGKAESFPSKNDPRTGYFIMQSKHVNNPLASISDSDFFSETSTSDVINKEIAKLLGLIKGGETIDNYILFTNRNNPGDKHIKIEKYIRDKTGIKNVFIGSTKWIDGHLIDYSSICKQFNLSFNFESIDINSQNIADLIDFFYDELKNVNNIQSQLPDDEFDFVIPSEKAQLNNMSDSYFQTSIEEYDTIYPKIQMFITDPRNHEFQKKYSQIIGALRDEISAKKNNYDSMDLVFTDIYNTVETERLFIEKGINKLFIKIFLGFAFVNCDLGQKTSEEAHKKTTLDQII